MQPQLVGRVTKSIELEESKKKQAEVVGNVVKERQGSELPSKKSDTFSAFSSVSTYFQLSTQIQGPNVATVFLLYLGMEVLIAYSYIHSLLMPAQKTYTEYILDTDSHSDRLYFISQICRYISPSIALFFCYVANNYFGEKPVLLLGLIFGSLSPIVNMISVITNISVEIRIYFLYSSPFVGMLLFSSEIFRKIVVLQQLKYPDQYERTRVYVFWFCFLEEIGILLGFLAMRLAINVNGLLVVNVYFCVFLYITHFLIFLKVKDKLITQKPIRKILHTYISLCYKFRNVRNPNEIQTDDNDENRQLEKELLNEARHFFDTAVIFLPFIIHGAVLFVLKYVTYSLQSPYLPRYAYVEYVDVVVIHVILIIIAMTLAEFVVLPLLWGLHLVRTFLQNMGITFIYLAFGVVCCAIIDPYINAGLKDMPREGVGQLTLFNVIQTTVIIETNYHKELYAIRASSMLRLLDIPCTKSVEIRLSVFSSVLNGTYDVTVREKHSYSLIISNKGLTRIKQRDPFPQGSLRSSDYKHVNCFVITNLENLSGKIIMNNEKDFLFRFYQHFDSVVLNIPAHSYSITFSDGKRNFNLVERKSMRNNHMYILVIYGDSEEYINSTIHAIKIPEVLGIEWVIPQLFFMGLAELPLRITSYSFVLSEAPYPVRATCICLPFVFSQAVVPSIWLERKERFSTSAFVACFFFTVFGFLVFLYVASQYSHSKPRQ